MATLIEQVRAAFKRSGWPVQKLLDESGLTCDRSSLHRKLHGEQPASSTELEAMATALGVTLAFVPEEKAS